MAFTECQQRIVANGVMPTVQQILADRYTGKIDEDEAVEQIGEVVNFYNVVCRPQEEDGYVKL